MIMRIIIN